MDFWDTLRGLLGLEDEPDRAMREFPMVGVTNRRTPEEEQNAVMRRLAQEQMRHAMIAMEKPGAQVVDFPPAPPKMTDEEHDAMRRAANAHGYTYRPFPETSVPGSSIGKALLLP